MPYNFQPHLVGGGLREDAISGLDSKFAAALAQLYLNAPPEIRAQLNITSAFRSPEVQARLWKDAVAKYGSEAAARKWVAPPGRSFHNRGGAIDFKYGNDAARQWVHDNAAAYGLYFPMAHEPWHIEMAGSRGGDGGLAGLGGHDHSAHGGQATVQAGVEQPQEEPQAPLWEMMKRNEEGEFGETAEGLVRIPGTGLALNQKGLGGALMALGGAFT